MSYDTIRNGLTGILKGLALQESSVITDFSEAPANEKGDRFILTAVSGEMDSESSEMMIDRFYDFQEWRVQIAFPRSTLNDLVNYNRMHRKKDALLAAIDSPSNWTSFARVVKYKSWATRSEPSLFIMTIEILVQHQYNY